MTAHFIWVRLCAISISDKAVAVQEAASLYQAGIPHLHSLYRNAQYLRARYVRVSTVIE